MHANQIARGGMMTGVSGARCTTLQRFLSIASWAACMLIGFIPELFFLTGQKTGYLVYAATSVLSLFLLPDKAIAVLYAGLFGLYTVLRFLFERIPSRVLRWVCKLIFGNIWVLIVLWCIRTGFLPNFPIQSDFTVLIVFIAGNLILIYYDLCLSRIFPGLRGLAQRLQNNSFK